ncbi:Delta(14)-sterol reductase [Piedraia hortae CBS 480.64]|uniref:Delta(14)-sterol reductase n=1 Tax=Piedraia hortae CBS 480.64 TaxID=1314780 RepID=A0A6A7BRS5_9PEZI|nr:Delta(14)-sterol reductase [Piedraia hortae CBS 480.64]
MSTRKTVARSVSTRSRPKVGEAHGYEFGGPIGAALISFGLPLVCYAFTFLCNDVSGCPAPSLRFPLRLFSSTISQSPLEHALQTLKSETGWPGFCGLINAPAFLGSVAWYVLSLLLWAFLPAKEVRGVKLQTGGRLRYRFNAFLSATVILAACAAGTWVQGSSFPLWTFIQRNYLQLLTSNIVISYLLATYVYVRSFSVTPDNDEKRELAAGGHSGNVIYDWFIGRELNPRVKIPGFDAKVDIKSFMELRPGMLGWIILDFAFMAKQYHSYGYVSDSMILVTLTQAIYVLDALCMEPAILTTMDITTDGFGFMLAFGDLVWVPFVYSLQARYLSVHPVMLGPKIALGIVAVQLIGYYIFRASNSQKNTFRTNPHDPSVAHLTYMETRAGSKLLTSGWWGAARHINYLGDWIMSWAYCLPTLLAGYKIRDSILHPGTRLVSTDGMVGTAIPITYFYLLYFAILLIHREHRDEEKCRRKYGKDWDDYCRHVPWRIIPCVY